MFNLMIVGCDGSPVAVSHPTGAIAGYETDPLGITQSGPLFELVIDRGEYAVRVGGEAVQATVSGRLKARPNKQQGRVRVVYSNPNRGGAVTTIDVDITRFDLQSADPLVVVFEGVSLRQERGGRGVPSPARGSFTQSPTDATCIEWLLLDESGEVIGTFKTST